MSSCGAAKEELEIVSGFLAQTDKKYLGQKTMVQEIREIVERRRAADSSLSAVSSSAPFASRLTPDLTFNYKDRCAPGPRPNCCMFCVYPSSAVSVNDVILLYVP